MIGISNTLLIANNFISGLKQYINISRFLLIITGITMKCSLVENQKKYCPRLYKCYENISYRYFYTNVLCEHIR